MCPCPPLCSNKASISSPLICPSPGRNWTSWVKGGPLLSSATSCSLTHFSTSHHGCPWENGMWIVFFLLFLLLLSSRFTSDVICLLMWSYCSTATLLVAMLDHMPEFLSSCPCSSTLCQPPSSCVLYCIPNLLSLAWLHYPSYWTPVLLIQPLQLSSPAL